MQLAGGGPVLFPLGDASGSGAAPVAQTSEEKVSDTMMLLSLISSLVLIFKR